MQQPVVFLEASGLVIVPQTHELFARALRRYYRIAAQTASLTDCASSIIMEDEGVTVALNSRPRFYSGMISGIPRAQTPD